MKIASLQFAAGHVPHLDGSLRASGIAIADGWAIRREGDRFVLSRGTFAGSVPCSWAAEVYEPTGPALAPPAPPLPEPRPVPGHPGGKRR